MSIHSYKNPEDYNKNNSLQYHFAMNVINNLKIDNHSRILDLGCGDGLVTYKLANLVNEGCVLGTDISPEMIEFANKKYQSEKNLRFIQMDTSQNFFRDQFDLITSFNSLHWVKDQERALKGIARAVVKKGKIILLFSHKKSLYHQALDILCAKDKWNFYFKNYSNPRSFFELTEYEILLRNSGLEIHSIQEKEMNYNFNSVVKFQSFLASSMANIKQVPLHEKENFLNDYCEEFFSLLNHKDITNISVAFWCLEVIAIKHN